MQQNGVDTAMDKRNLICTLGQYDIPIVQKQPLFKVDLLDKNIALFGAAMSGKTNFLKLLIQTLHIITNPDDEEIFILDFGGALASYKTMPLVAAYLKNMLSVFSGYLKKESRRILRFWREPDFLHISVKKRLFTRHL